MKNKSSGKISFMVTALFGLVGIIVLVWYMSSSNSIPSLNEYVNKTEEKSGLLNIKTPNGNIFLKIATSSEDLEKGLSGTESIPNDQGMLFAFSEPDKRGFWMLDMSFPIDIVWVDENKTVIGITPNLSPDTYPNIFFPPGPIMYAIELNAGYAEKNGIATGTPLTFVI